MALIRVGVVGWRGMVGSVLLDRMRAERDFVGLQPRFYSTSQVGQPAPDVGVQAPALFDAFDVHALRVNQAIITCQGGAYSRRMLPELRQAGWRGYWIDASSAFRMSDDAVIALDPVNRPTLDAAFDAGCLNYIGGNCTVSLMLMALHGLFRADLVEWMTCVTYQAASGSGARAMRELIQQMRAIGQAAGPLLDDPATAIGALDRQVQRSLTDGSLPMAAFGGVPLAGSVLPWIDTPGPAGATREEHKAHAEGNKILGRTDHPVPIDSLCVRVGAMRCHSQAVTLKLRRDVPLADIEALLDQANPWVRLIPNQREPTLRELTPARVSGTLDVPIGRVRKLRMGGQHLTAFTVGDQLLWGAAEPLRRVLQILRGKLG